MFLGACRQEVCGDTRTMHAGSSSSGFREHSKAITLAEPGQTWLQLSEVSMRAAEGMLASSNCADQLLGYDVAAFLFDCSRPQSFREARLLLEHVATASGNSMPCLLVATKDDLGMHKVCLIAGLPALIVSCLPLATIKATMSAYARWF